MHYLRRHHSFARFGSSAQPARRLFGTLRLLLPFLLTVIGNNAICRSTEIQSDPASSAQQSQGGELPDTADFDKELERARTLVLPMQKSWARDYIKQYPNSPEAKIAQELLDEYTLYDAHAEALNSRDQQHSLSIRAHWQSRQQTGRAVRVAAIRITNHCEIPVIYQVNGPSMQWTGPHRLRAGHTHQLHYPALYRRFTADGIHVYSLQLGGHYVFRRRSAADLPSLFRADDR